MRSRKERLRDALIVARGFLLLPGWLLCFPYAFAVAALGLERGSASERFKPEQLRAMRKRRKAMAPPIDDLAPVNRRG